MGNNYQVFNKLKLEEENILKLREQGMSYKKLAKKFNVENHQMESFLRGIEISRIDDIFSELRKGKKSHDHDVSNIKDEAKSEIETKNKENSET